MVEDSPLVTREWLYTAITRAKETVILVATPKDVQAAVSRRSRRLTGFRL
jgi:exodeoxyribonuclease V alpha subunit